MELVIRKDSLILKILKIGEWKLFVVFASPGVLRNESELQIGRIYWNVWDNL